MNRTSSSYGEIFKLQDLHFVIPQSVSANLFLVPGASLQWSKVSHDDCEILSRCEETKCLKTRCQVAWVETSLKTYVKALIINNQDPFTKNTAMNSRTREEPKLGFSATGYAFLLGKLRHANSGTYACPMPC